jgi:hypothetical protein
VLGRNNVLILKVTSDTGYRRPFRSCFFLQTFTDVAEETAASFFVVEVFLSLRALSKFVTIRLNVGP